MDGHGTSTCFPSPEHSTEVETISLWGGSCSSSSHPLSIHPSACPSLYHPSSHICINHPHPSINRQISLVSLLLQRSGDQKDIMTFCLLLPMCDTFYYALKHFSIWPPTLSFHHRHCRCLFYSLSASNLISEPDTEPLLPITPLECWTVQSTRPLSSYSHQVAVAALGNRVKSSQSAGSPMSLD